MHGTTAASPGIPPCKHRSIGSDGWDEYAYDAKGSAGLDKLTEEDLATLHSILRKAKSAERRALPAA